jgi:hypothetical protein
MRESNSIYTIVYVAAVLAGTMRAAPAVPAQPQAASAIGRWYQSLPGWGCYAAPLPAGYQVKVPIGPEVDGFLGNPRAAENSARFGMRVQFTDRPLNVPFTRIGAIYDPAHRIALFQEEGQDRGNFRLIDNAGVPPVTVKEKDLSALAMGGEVHLGDRLDKVRAAFSVPSTFHLTTMKDCAFPRAAEYSAVIFYGPPHHPPISARYNNCRSVGPDIKQEQTLGTVVFRANRVTALEWDYAACAY